MDVPNDTGEGGTPWGGEMPNFFTSSTNLWCFSSPAPEGGGGPWGRGIELEADEGGGALLGGAIPKLEAVGRAVDRALGGEPSGLGIEGVEGGGPVGTGMEAV